MSLKTLALVSAAVLSLSPTVGRTPDLLPAPFTIELPSSALTVTGRVMDATTAQPLAGCADLRAWNQQRHPQQHSREVHVAALGRTPRVRDHDRGQADRILRGRVSALASRRAPTPSTSP